MEDHPGQGRYVCRPRPNKSLHTIRMGWTGFEVRRMSTLELFSLQFLPPERGCWPVRWGAQASLSAVTASCCLTVSASASAHKHVH